MKRIFQYWRGYRFPKSLRNERDQQVYILKRILVAALFVLISITMIILFGGFLGLPVSINWWDIIFTFSFLVVGLIFVQRGKIMPARYMMVLAMLFLGLWHTVIGGLSTLFVLYYVVGLIFSFMLLERRFFAVLSIILLPLIVDIRLNFGPDYNYGRALTFLGFTTGITLLLVVFNRIVELFEDERNQVLEVDRVRQAGTSLMTSLDMKETIYRILDQLMSIVPYDSASVLLMRGEDELEIVGGHGWEEDDKVLGLQFLVPGDNPNTVVIETGQPHILGNAPAKYPEFKKDPHSHILSWLGVPLISDGEIIGMMAIDSSKPNYFSEDHVRVVSSYADHVSIAIENSLLYEFANQSIERRSILHQASQDVIKASADLEEIYLAIYSAASRLLPCEAFAITLIVEDIVEGVYLMDRGHRDENMIVAKGSGLSGKVIESKKSILIDDYHNSEELTGTHFGKRESIRSLVAVPLMMGGEAIGMLTAQSYEPNAYTEEDVELLEMLGATAAIAIKNAQLLAEVEHLARTDGLTGLLNRRAFDEKLIYEISRASRYNYQLSLLMIDVDDFKQFNDKFGHSRGDEHLKLVSGVITQSVRQPDMVARIGGEEFTVILPHTSKQGGIKLAERVRKAVAKGFVSEEYPASTVSIGVATYPDDASSIKELYEAADNAMFDAKDTGKNRVVPATRTESVH